MLRGLKEPSPTRVRVYSYDVLTRKFRLPGIEICSSVWNHGRSAEMVLDLSRNRVVARLLRLIYVSTERTTRRAFAMTRLFLRRTHVHDLDSTVLIPQVGVRTASLEPTLAVSSVATVFSKMGTVLPISAKQAAPSRA